MQSGIVVFIHLILIIAEKNRKITNRTKFMAFVGQIRDTLYTRLQNAYGCDFHENDTPHDRTSSGPIGVVRFTPPPLEFMLPVRIVFTCAKFVGVSTSDRYIHIYILYICKSVLWS